MDATARHLCFVSGQPGRLVVGAGAQLLLVDVEALPERPQAERLVSRRLSPCLSAPSPQDVSVRGETSPAYVAEPLR